ncbi:MAG TPA: endonuclease III [Candidatus Binatia bacterium]|nr:endonuclease III [Candidatus Binatia bacterium]
MATPRKSTARDRLNHDRLQKIIGALQKAHPDAKLDLDFTNPLELLVALILAAQARDDLVNQITVELFKKYRSAQDYTRSSQARLEKEIGKINFYRTKARAIRNCCKTLVERFGGKVPDKLDELLALPGVGHKTANIVLGNAFDQPVIGVDTHVMRLSQRLGFTKHTDPDKIEFELTPLVPERQRVRFCHLLQYHGRRICVAKRPRCPDCTVRPLCPYPDKTPA